MKKHFQLLITGCCIFTMSCNNATPENYFDRAVLTSNMLAGFAGDGLDRELESPSVKMGDHGEPIAMKRSEELAGKIKNIEEDFENLKKLKETDETREMIKASLAVYEYVLPVFKTEYARLARLYDEGASKQSIEAATKVLHNKYYEHYQQLYDKLISLGKIYAEKNSIRVNWNVGV